MRFEDNLLTNSARYMTYLDLSGYMFSGKSAVTNLFQEIRGFFVPPVIEEFDLIRIQGGIADLEDALIRRWSPIRSDAAIKRFVKISRAMGRSPTGIARLYKYGFGYNEKYPNFDEEVSSLVKKLTKQKTNQEWPYPLVNDRSPYSVFIEKLERRILHNFVLWPKVEYYHASGEDFYNHVQEFIHNILSSRAGSDDHTIVLNNALEPYCPQNYFKYFKSVKSIVVERDPRDVYITARNFQDSNNEYRDAFTASSCAHDVDAFIERIRIQKLKVCYDSHPDVLRVSFEDLVLDYEATRKSIFKFLGIDEVDHIRKFQHFDPKRSLSNCRMWRDYPDQDSINKISSGLSLSNSLVGPGINR